MNRFWKTTLCAWILFIGIDFFFHAGLIYNLYAEKIPGLLADKDLFARIPLGYVGFLLLTILVGYIFNKIYRERLTRMELIKFGSLVAGLFSVSNFLALYSFLEIPLIHLTVFNIVYLIEIYAVIHSFNIGLFTDRFRRYAIGCLMLFLSLVIAGTILQNVF
jgi:hypothetical protein